MAHKKMNLKPKKKRKKIKLLFYLLIIYIGFACTFYHSLKKHKTISNKEFINLLITTGNPNILKKYKLTSIVNGTMKIIFKIDFTKPYTLLDTSILKYGEKITPNEKTVILEYNDDYSNMEELKKISDYIEDPNKKEISSPLIYIYNSHQLENYNNKDLDIYGITPNVLMASYILKDNLNKLGINTIVEESNMSDILTKHNWNYSYSYEASRLLLESIKKKNPTLNYFIDIHRDSVSKDYTTVTINNKQYAKVLFVIGLEHNNWQKNNELANKLNNLINDNYKGLSRGILKKEGPNVNGIYNQDFSPNTILIEVGGVDNTIEEVYNTLSALAQIITKYIKEK